MPIFVELRRIQADQTLSEVILAGLKTLGLKLTVEAFDELASSGRLLLLLDAFDEVREDAKERIIIEVEELIKNHEKLRVVVTSRPHSGLDMSPHFQVVRLSNLENSEYKHVISKLIDDAEFADQLIKQVAQHPGEVKDLLSTPLLVTLLILNYKSFQKVPDQLSEFYESLFQLLLQRHDGTKAGYKRFRRCGINDTEYRRVFEAFCFLSKRNRDRQMSHANAIDLCQQALRELKVAEDAQKFLTDVVSITCLLLRDGEEYRFIHKSVQEYHAASFIKQKPDVVAEKFYQQVFPQTLQSEWWQELRFLRDIDQYRYNKYGLIPFLCTFLDLPEQKLIVAATEDIRQKVFERLSPLRLELSEPVSGAGIIMPIEARAFGPLIHECVKQMLSWDLSETAVLLGEATETRKRSHRYASLRELQERGIMKTQINTLVDVVGTRALELGKAALEQVKAQEADVSLLDVIQKAP